MDEEIDKLLWKLLQQMRVDGRQTPSANESGWESVGQFEGHIVTRCKEAKRLLPLQASALNRHFQNTLLKKILVLA